MSPTTGYLQAPGVCFPRVSGDEPPAITAGRMKIAFSPRERG